MKIKVALYGDNGHMIGHQLENHAGAELTATAAVNPLRLSPSQRANSHIRLYGSLSELLTNKEVELVSLCSPKRLDQADDAIACLRAGKHVYAEKPCAMREEDLDRIIEAARVNNREFHEMTGTAFGQPYLAMRHLVQNQTIGTVVQVLVQKSYPSNFASRPQDEAVDGGLLCQVGIHTIRYIEHVAGQKVESVEAFETGLGNPGPGNLKMAACFILRLKNGGVASAISNYLNPKGFGKHGNEHLRIFGTLGFVEAVDGGARTRLILGDKDCGPIDVSEPSKDYFDYFISALRGEGSMPLTLEDELHPTRIVIRAKASAQRCSAGVPPKAASLTPETA